jgi:hypothetical protein
MTLAFSMLESLDQDSTSPSTKAILFTMSSRKDIDTRFFSKPGTYKTFLK